MDQEEFKDHLHEALNHLHDPGRLCRSPLADFFGVAGRRDTYVALQRLLIKAIDALVPAADVPADSRAWRIHDLLACRYVQQMSGPVVADQLGVSLRHLRREQHAAIDALAVHLWDRFDLGSRSLTPASAPAAGKETGSSSALLRELSWVRDTALAEGSSLAEHLAVAVKLFDPLRARLSVRLETKVADSLPALAVHPVALRQVLLNALTISATKCPGQTVRLVADPLAYGAQVVISGTIADGGRAGAGAIDAERLRACRQLVRMCRGGIAISAQDGFCLTLSLPAFEGLPVIVIDDNADTLALMARFATGTRYRVIGAQNLDEALLLVENGTPAVIVLDVMMPDVDGWQVLGHLREDPLTENVSVVICSVLPEEELALSLGARGFLRKPLTQQSFLDALDLHVAEMEPARC